MLMIKERRPPIRTLRGWAISVLQEAGGIRAGGGLRDGRGARNDRRYLSGVPA
jgi:hypothetical protein